MTIRRHAKINVLAKTCESIEFPLMIKDSFYYTEFRFIEFIAAIVFQYVIDYLKKF